MLHETFRTDHDPIAVGHLLDRAVTRPAPWRVERNPTGFVPLDPVLDGGFAPEDLVVVGGRPGVGKTVAALQWATAAAAAGRRAVYVSYEHSPASLLGRVLLAQAAAGVDDHQLPDAEKLAGPVRALMAGLATPEQLVEDHPLLAPAVAAVRSIGDHLVLVGASGRTTDLEGLARVADDHLVDGGLLVVDYLQKVPVGGGSGAEDATRAVEGLKDLALETRCTVVAVAAADQPGLQARRINLHDFRGSTAIAYEADVVLTLEEKSRAVSRVHAAFDTTRLPSFRDRVVFSLAKNRGGPTDVQMEFRKRFASFRFDPVGEFVAEKLVDDLVYLD